MATPQPTTQDYIGSGEDVTTAAPGNSDEGNNEVLIIALVVPFVVLAIAGAVTIVVCCYRRKTGSWPKLFRRRRQHQANPFGNKSYAARWQKGDTANGNKQITSHRTDFRQPPTPEHHKKVYSITERISEHLFEASEKASRENPVTISPMRGSSASGKVTDAEKNSSQRQVNVQVASTRSSSRKRPSARLNGDFGVYHDRTLPATLMMTSESKQQMFANEDIALKRSNSATLRSSSKAKSSRGPNKTRRPYSGDMHMYNDFGPPSSAGRYGAKRALRKTSNLSHLSSKPSNTSDYVSDIDASTDGRGWKKRHNGARIRAEGKGKRVSECDSLYQDTSISEKSDILQAYENELGQALHEDSSALTVLRAGLSKDRTIGNLKSKLRHQLQGRAAYDDRTESQQNTMKSEAFYNFAQQISEEDTSAYEGQQSSDTESMAESYATAVNSGSLRSRRRQYDSDGGSRVLGGSGRVKSRNKTKRRCRRTRSDGWDSEPGQDTIQRKRRNSSARARQRRNDATSKPASDLSKNTVKYSRQLATVINIEVDKTNINENVTPDKHKLRGIRSSPVSSLSSTTSTLSTSVHHHSVQHQSSSLKAPIGGTVLEMPIYSQATWAGPSKHRSKASSNFTAPHGDRPASAASSNHRRSVSRKNRRHGRNGRKLSIGGGGRFFCEYGSLPVDLSKLPKDLIAKIGGQPDQLLEPIDQLNFDKLCRPLPVVGKTEGELSARRLVAEKMCLPLDHRDREVLSNTYEYEETGIVMTDL